MNISEENTQVFIVRIWLEPREIEGADPLWRGMIQHLPSSEQRYVKSLDEIVTFIAICLKAMGVKLEGRSPRDWLAQAVHRLRPGRLRLP